VSEPFRARAAIEKPGATACGCACATSAAPGRRDDPILAAIPLSEEVVDIPGVVNQAPYFHDITDDDVKNDEIPDIDWIVCVFAPFSGAIRSKQKRVVCPLFR